MTLCNCRMGKHQANCGLFHSGEYVLSEEAVFRAWQYSDCICTFDYYRFAQDSHDYDCPLWLQKRMRRGEELLDGIAPEDPSRPLVIYPAQFVEGTFVGVAHDFDVTRHRLYLVGVLRGCKPITREDR